MAVLHEANRNVFQAATRASWLPGSVAYHCSVKPFHPSPNLAALNENTTTATIGAYRKTKSARAVARRKDELRFTAIPLPHFRAFAGRRPKGQASQHSG